MKFTRKMMLALAVVGAGVLTSCKDYEESDYTEVVVSLGQAEKDVATLQFRVDSLAKELAQGGSCHCQGIKIVQNSEGTFTVETKDGIKATFSPSTPAAPGDPSSVQQDTNGQFVTAPDGTKIYVPTIINEGDKYYIYQNGQQVEIPTGNSSIITVGEDGSITIDDGKHDPVVLGKVKSDVTVQKDGKGNPISLTITTYDNAGKEVGKTIVPVFSDAEKTAWNKAVTDLAALTLIVQGADGKGGLVADMKDVQKNTSDIFKELYGEGGTPAAPKEGSAMARLSQLEEDFEALKEAVENLQDARAKQITGIVVQQVTNPAFGTYRSLLTNAETNLLVAFYGEASKYIEFPSVDPQVVVKAGKKLLKGEGNAGKVWLTINPNTVDMTGFKGLTLENSQQQACGIVLGELQPSETLIHMGFTRSAENGLYEATATLPLENIDDPKLHIQIDKSLVKNKMKEAVSSAKGKKIAPTMKALATIGYEAIGALNKIEGQAVKSSWTDKFGEHSVYSNYNIGALAVQPVGFNAVDGIFADGGQYWRGYDKAKRFIDKTYNKIATKLVNTLNDQFKLNKIKADLADVRTKIHRIDSVKISPDAFRMKVELDTTMYLAIKANPTVTADPKIDWSEALGSVTIYEEYVLNPDGTITGKPGTEKTVKTLEDENKIKITVNPDVKVDFDIKSYDPKDPAYTVVKIEFKNTRVVDMTQKVQSMVDEINAGFSDTNLLLDAMETLLGDAQDMLENINKIEQKILDGVYMERVYKYMDKIAKKIGDYTPMLFKPALLMNSDSGFGLVGSKGAPSVVKTTNVTVLPTTYAAELLTPIYKKYVRVNGVDGKIVEGQELEITLQKGINKIEYYALDYQGNEIGGEYYIEVK